MFNLLELEKKDFKNWSDLQPILGRKLSEIMLHIMDPILVNMINARLFSLVVIKEPKGPDSSCNPKNERTLYRGDSLESFYYCLARPGFYAENVRRYLDPSRASHNSDSAWMADNVAQSTPHLLRSLNVDGWSDALKNINASYQLRSGPQPQQPKETTTMSNNTLESIATSGITKENLLEQHPLPYTVKGDRVFDKFEREVDPTLITSFINFHAFTSLMDLSVKITISEQLKKVATLIASS